MKLNSNKTNLLGQVKNSRGVVLQSRGQDHNIKYVALTAKNNHFRTPKVGHYDLSIVEIQDPILLSRFVILFIFKSTTKK